jgi:hypothetical protein
MKTLPLGYDAKGRADLTFKIWCLMERLEVVANLQYQNADYNTIFSSTNKAGLKQTVLVRNI